MLMNMRTLGCTLQKMQTSQFMTRLELGRTLASFLARVFVMLGSSLSCGKSLVKLTSIAAT